MSVSEIAMDVEREKIRFNPLPAELIVAGTSPESSLSIENVRLDDLGDLRLLHVGTYASRRSR